MLLRIKAMAQKAAAFFLRKIKSVITSIKYFVKKSINNAKEFFVALAIKLKDRAIVIFNNVSEKVKAYVMKNIVENSVFGAQLVKISAVSFFKGLRGGIKNAFNQFLCSAKKKLSESKGAGFRLAVLASGVVAGVMCLSSVVYWNLNTVALSVYANGQHVGYVSSAEQYYYAYNEAAALLVADNPHDYVKNVSYSYSVVNKNKISGTDEIAIGMLEAQQGIASAYGLYREGEFVACASGEEVILLALDSRKTAYVTENTIEVNILDDLKIKPIYYPANGSVDDGDARAIICSSERLPLQIETVDLVTEQQVVRYETVKVKDSTKVLGYNRVSVKGSDGLSNVTGKYVKINGSQTDYVVVSTEVVKEPVNMVIVSGTSTTGASSVQQSLAAKGLSFVWPIAVTDRMYISSYWGDGRNHKGLDITGYEGTDIFASCEGTVTYAGTANGYGNVVYISHKNGYSTVYAHMSKIYVKKGDKVTAGQVIGACGHTGVATGNHVHFEIKINGTAVNPAPYLGVK